MPTLTLLPPGPRAPAAGLHLDRVGLGALARSEANPTGRPPSALSVFPSLGRTGDGGSRDRGPGAGGPGGPGRPFPSHFQRKGNEMSLPTRCPFPRDGPAPRDTGLGGPASITWAVQVRVTRLCPPRQGRVGQTLPESQSGRTGRGRGEGSWYGDKCPHPAQCPDGTQQIRKEQTDK